MGSTELLRSELTHYLILADQLKTQYGDIDDETLRDTLDGITELPDLITEVVRSSLEDERGRNGRHQESARYLWQSLRTGPVRQGAEWGDGAQAAITRSIRRL